MTGRGGKIINKHVMTRYIERQEAHIATIATKIQHRKWQIATAPALRNHMA